MEIIIPLAGKATRWAPWSEVPGLSKALLPINNFPALSCVVMEMLEVARALEPTKKPHIVLVVSDAKKDPVLMQALQKPDYYYPLKIAGASNYTTVVQTEAKGLGHAVALAARHTTGDRFLVALPDEIVIKEKPGLPYHFKIESIDLQKNVSFVLGRNTSAPEKYGIMRIDLNKESKTYGYELIEEKPKNLQNGVAVRGRYLLPRSIVSHIEKSPTNQAGEIDLSYALSQTGVKCVWLEDHADIWDIGTPSAYLDLCAELKYLGDKIHEPR